MRSRGPAVRPRRPPHHPVAPRPFARPECPHAYIFCPHLPTLADPRTATVAVRTAGLSARAPGPLGSLRSQMRALLTRALAQSDSCSSVELLHPILARLVADEAAIIGRLSDGSASPPVNGYDW